MKNWKFIIGVDVSKETLDVHSYEHNAYTKVKNGSEGFKALKNWCSKLSIDFKDTIIVMEYTGGYEYKLAQFCQSKGIAYTRIPGLEIKRSMGIVRGKSDKIDSKRIAQYADEKRKTIKLSRPIDSKIKELRELLSLRKRMVRQLAGYKSKLSERLHMYEDIDHEFDLISTTCKSEIKHLEEQVKVLEKAIKALINKNAEMKLNYKIITSIKGIGMVNAAMTIAYTENFQSFPNARAYAVYVGVVPFEYSSGTSLNRKKKVSKINNKEIKQELSQAAKSAIIHDPELKAYAERKLNNKERGLVLNNVKFKLILRMFALVKRQEMFVDKYQKAS
jgi:transposase